MGVLGTAPAHAEEAAPAPAVAPPRNDDAPITPRIRLHHDVLVDGVATGAMAVSLVTWGFLKTDIGIDHCVICDGDKPGEVNAVDDFSVTPSAGVTARQRPPSATSSRTAADR